MAKIETLYKVLYMLDESSNIIYNIEIACVDGKFATMLKVKAFVEDNEINVDRAFLPPV